MRLGRTADPDKVDNTIFKLSNIRFKFTTCSYINKATYKSF